ncbi:(E3-independent) E2 ubiquitin-conjugating enzyme UBE2O [Anabrus simplex]|uniref:(E3-independent) E2 ubiquitin-conjugating enzyme UBE2O n=1 Tax=Anabrus simplex TaxID=316456 RepID=UPI0035A2C264
MAAEHQFFYEDEVYRINKKGNIEFGMVLENSELVSSDENSDVEEGGRMKKGHIRVAWHPTGVEVISERKVQLADRSLMPGDVVRRMIKGKDTQRGYCRDIKVTANVQVVGTKQVIPNVKSEHLIPLEEFATDIAACLDSWVGGIKTVHSKLQIRCPDGSRCIINDIEACGLEDFNEKRDCQDCEFPAHREDFYPGQILWGPLHCLEDAEWLHCTKELKALRSKPNKTVKVVVEEVKTESVGVHWQCRAYSKDGAGSEKEQPKFLVQGEDLLRLKLLNVFEPCTLQVGDRNFYTFRDEDTFLPKEQWRRSQRDLVLANSVNNGPANFYKRSPKRLKNKVSDAPNNMNGPTSGLAVSEPAGGPTVMDVSPVQEEDEWDTEDTGSMSDAASISSSCSSVGSQGKKKRGPALMTKMLKKKKLRRTRKRVPTVPLQPGVRVVVETLSTSSIADVIWQDGSVELGIPSTQLYPIHHLDDQEFFPGDFVIENKEEGCMQVYGVVQSVDHAGRTATVKWFKTYTSLDQPQPTMLEQSEVSVYDLKDHPDFQYRPGTVVIRVANFEGEDANCTAGQVLDNYPEGKVRVWWVDGHVSMSWPQDLYKVGEYDSDEGELWDDNSSEASWETESEDCVVFEEEYPEEDLQEMLKPKLAANIEKARIAMSRLEEIFTQNPALQTTSVMRQLLDVYKDCRYLDKLMGTSFFHESHFQGLLERVRERGRANVAQRVADQVSRLFSEELSSTTFLLTRGESVEGDQGSEPGKDPPCHSVLSKKSSSHVSQQKNNGVIDNECKSLSTAQLEDSGVSSLVASNKDSSESSTNDSYGLGEFPLSENLVNLEQHVVTAANNSKNNEASGVSVSNCKEIVKENNSKSGQRSFSSNKSHMSGDDRSNMKHNGCHSVAVQVGSVRSSVAVQVGSVRSKTERTQSSTTLPEVGAESTQPDSTSSLTKSVTVSNSHVCVKLCSLIKAQLVKAHAEVTRRFGGNQGLTGLRDALSDTGNVRSSGDTSVSDRDNEGSEQTMDTHEKEIGTGLRSLLSKSSPLIFSTPVVNGHEETTWSKKEREADKTGNSDVIKEGANETPVNESKLKMKPTALFRLVNTSNVSKVPSSTTSDANAAEEGGSDMSVSNAPCVPSVASVPSIETQGANKQPKVENKGSGVSEEEVGSLGEGSGGFSIMDSAPSSHKFKLTMFQPTDPQHFYRTVRKELKLLRTSLPEGIWVKGFEDRMDLYSVMIRGPEKTPYEDGLFFFDFQLSAEYPKAPPLCHYISYCSDRLNPNLYEDGKVCVSLLGTWSGKGTEVWTLNSNLLQVIISIQGLILVSEPYFNEAGYEKQKGSQQGKENSRMYNEMAVLKLVQAMTKLLLQPPPVFREEIVEHFRLNAHKLLDRLETWLEISERYNNSHPVTPTTPTSFRELHGEAISSAINVQLPDFPLIPASKGFCLTLRKTLVTFREVLSSVGISQPLETS